MRGQEAEGARVRVRVRVGLGGRGRGVRRGHAEVQGEEGEDLAEPLAELFYVQEEVHPELQRLPLLVDTLEETLHALLQRLRLADQLRAHLVELREQHSGGGAQRGERRGGRLWGGGGIRDLCGGRVDRVLLEN